MATEGIIRYSAALDVLFTESPLAPPSGTGNLASPSRDWNIPFGPRAAAAPVERPCAGAGVRGVISEVIKVPTRTRTSRKCGSNAGEVKVGDVIAGRVALRTSEAAAHADADPREQAGRGLLGRQAAAHEAQLLLDEVETGVGDAELHAGLLVDVAQGEDHAVLGKGKLDQLWKDGGPSELVGLAITAAVTVTISVIFHVVILLLLLGQSLVLGLFWLVAGLVEDVAEVRRHVVGDLDVSHVSAVLIGSVRLSGGIEPGVVVDRV